MALTSTISSTEAQAIKTVCDSVAQMLLVIDSALEHNSDLAIDWAAAEKPAYIDEDAAGNISGQPYSRADVANAIGSLNWIRSLLKNQNMTGSQGDHLGNINKLASPGIWRVRVGN